MSSKLFRKRKIICEKCEKLTYALQFKDKPLLPKCNECGCFMQIKWRFDYSSCPLNKW